MKYIPVPTAGKGNTAGLCAALYQLLQDAPEMPSWCRGAAREMCRDFSITMMPDTSARAVSPTVWTTEEILAREG